MVNNFYHLLSILNLIDHTKDTEYCFNGLVDHHFQYFIIPSFNVNPVVVLYDFKYVTQSSVGMMVTFHFQSDLISDLY